MQQTNTTKPIRLAITAGEPAGIGPDIILQLACQKTWPAELVVIADPLILQNRAQKLGLTVRIRHYPLAAEDLRALQLGDVLVLPITCPDTVLPGVLNPKNADYVLATLRRANEGCLSGEFAGMVTAPLHKGVINDAGVPFTGHTEYLAELTRSPLPVMMLTAGRLRVALATTHLPLKNVSAAITWQSLQQVLTILNHDLQTKFGLSNPHILVCGLNPHAGEGGHLGMEEQETIIPVIRHLQQQGMHLTGPLPADTLFTPRLLKTADAVLAMYHDQGLPVLKNVGFGHAVNITLGLPIIRTSVDHGTALDLAGSGKAETGSLQAAIQLALDLALKTAY
jgi:4-hydroxythreonine-4-phosphate dehydrogenase